MENDSAPLVTKFELGRREFLAGRVLAQDDVEIHGPAYAAGWDAERAWQRTLKLDTGGNAYVLAKNNLRIDGHHGAVVEIWYDPRAREPA